MEKGERGENFRSVHMMGFLGYLSVSCMRASVAFYRIVRSFSGGKYCYGEGRENVRERWENNEDVGIYFLVYLIQN